MKLCKIISCPHLSLSTLLWPQCTILSIFSLINLYFTLFFICICLYLPTFSLICPNLTIHIDIWYISTICLYWDCTYVWNCTAIWQLRMEILHFKLCDLNLTWGKQRVYRNLSVSNRISHTCNMHPFWKNGQLKTHWPWFDFSMSSKVKLYMVNWKAMCDLLCVSYKFDSYDALFTRYNLLKVMRPLFDL